MPAKIVIVSGPDKGREISVESRVTTIGGHPGSEIRLQGQADTVATLRFRAGLYTVFNRCDVPLELTGQELSRDGSAVWKNGHELVLPGGSVLKLSIQGDPEPARAAVVAEDPEEPDDYLEADSDENPLPKKSQTTEMTVIGICVILCGWLLVSDESSNLPDRNLRKDYHDIVMALLRPEIRPTSAATATRPDLVLPARFQTLVKDATADDYVLFDGIRDLIQTARVAEMRGDRKLAISKYHLARDKLLDHIQGMTGSSSRGESNADGNGAPSTIFHEVLDHIQHQLGVLSN